MSDNFDVFTPTGASTTGFEKRTFRATDESGVITPHHISVPSNVISIVNSTATPLSSGASFTGTAEDVTRYNSIVVAFATDQNGYFTVQFSNDGTNWDSTLTRYYRTTQIEAPHRFTITRRYVRVTFTNTSASAQTYLRLQTVFGEKSPLNAPCDSNLAQDFDATVVRPTDFKHEVALGRRQGATLWNKFGYNSDIDTATDPEVIASFGGAFTPLTTASTLTVVSSSTDDDGSPAGIGANRVVVYGVDANRKSQTEIVTLNGTTNVVTTSTWLGVNRVAVYLAGSSLTNVGTITITATTGGSTQAEMPAGQGTTQQCIFFTQTDHQALFEWFVLNTLKQSGANPVVTIKGWVFSQVSNAKYEVFREKVDTSVENTVIVKPPLPFVVGEKSCFWLEAETTQDNTEVSARFSLIEYRDVDA